MDAPAVPSAAVPGAQDYSPATMDLGSATRSPPLPVKAIQTGNIQRFKELVHTKAAADRWYDDGITLLHIAAGYGQAEMVEYLLELGAEPDPPAGPRQYTPLQLAAAEGQTAVVSLLLDHGADPDRRDAEGRSAVHHAAAVGVPDILNELLDRHAAFRVGDNNGNRPIHYAAMRGHTPLIQRLVAAGEYIDTTNLEKFTPMHLAVRYGHDETVAFLLEKGADPNTSNQRGNTALHSAAYRNLIPIAQRLVEKGARIDPTTEHRHTPFHFAAENGHVEMLEWLAEQGADLRALTDNGATALHRAASRGREEAVLWLLEQGMEINTANIDGETPLYGAVGNNHIDVAAVLIERGADINAQRTNGWNAIMYAASRGFTRMADVLLDRGADFQAQRASGGTALYDAIANRNIPIAHRLIKAGADPNLSPPDSATPLIRAVRQGDLETVTLLLDHGADLTAEYDGGVTALRASIFLDDLDIARLLLERGAPIDQARHTWTPLNSAAWDDLPHAARLLLEYGADIERPAGLGQTPLITAARKGHREFADILLAHGANPWAETTNSLTPWHVGYQIGHTNITALLEERVPGMPPTNLALVRVYFEFDDPHATQVFVAGYFNDYSDTANPMHRDENGIWYTERDVFDTFHTYKFVADGSWMLDPTHTNVNFDSTGDTSIMWATNYLVHLRAERPRIRLPDPVMVRFVYTNELARQVFLAGEFNGWSTTSLPMQRAKNGTWQIETRIRPGPYGYKFIADGEWTLDPAHDATKMVGGVINSLVVVPPDDLSRSEGDPAPRVSGSDMH
jgi:ankyrin repeat protein